jgi:hypothetical protein
LPTRTQSVSFRRRASHSQGITELGLGHYAA